MLPRLLVYTRTTAYRHDSIPAAVAALRALGDFDVHHTEEPGDLEIPLDGYAAVVFLSTSGEVLTDAGRERLAAYVESGGGFVGVHAAACTEYEWPYYGELLGAWFDRHPEYQPGKAVVEDRDHPATRHLPAVWDFSDEWYDFRSNPRGAV
ncbi:ThuA domain-containing protein, partial [Streptomyces sp. PSKA30]|uniref:ThuA domain-containing protein n=1 Tax=Streptomyces sp. PSKA30 TaxID=2874597 RepID=UPI001CD06DE9